MGWVSGLGEPHSRSACHLHTRHAYGMDSEQPTDECEDLLAKEQQIDVLNKSEGPFDALVSVKQCAGLIEFAS